MFQQYDPVRVLGKLAFGQFIFDRLAWRQFRHVTLKQQHQTAMCVEHRPNRGLSIQFYLIEKLFPSQF